MNKANARITLIISTYNWPEALDRVLDGVCRQTELPDEVVIADDGSGAETGRLIEHFRALLPVPLKHVWHEDNGFRRTVILNKAVAAATGDYIVEMDGDVVPERHFIQDHREVMRPGCFVCGSRVLTQRDGSLRLSHCVNLLRSRLLRRLIASVQPRFSERHVRGCNLAFWRRDFIAVNGYNEDITGWGHEDREMVYRLLHRGVRERRLKFGGVIRHIWHEAPSMGSKRHNYSIQLDTQSSHSSWCEKGVSKYLRE